jgi:hypothetical protein
MLSMPHNPTNLCEICGAPAVSRHRNPRRFCSSQCAAVARHGPLLTLETLSQFYEVDPATGCWNWTRSKNTEGRATIRRGGLNVYAYRVVYGLLREPIPANLLACHSCDNPSCINPDHVFVGTIADNNLDMTVKGRAATGEKQPAHKMTEDAVREARHMRSAGWTYESIAKHFGVSYATAHRVANRAGWKHVV